MSKKTKKDNLSIKELNASKNIGFDIFDDLLNVICNKYSGLNSIQDKATKLFEDISKYLEKVKGYKLNKIDPITFICYLANEVVEVKEKIKRINNFLSEYNIKTDNNIYFDDLKGIPSKNLFSMAKKCKDKYPVDKLWELAIKINNRIPKIEDLDNIIEEITEEKSGVKITNLSAIMYLCKPKHFYCIDQNGAASLLDILNEEEVKEIIPMLKKIKGNRKGSCKNGTFSKLQKICKKNKDKIKTPYEFYLKSH